MNKHHEYLLDIPVSFDFCTKNMFTLGKR